MDKYHTYYFEEEFYRYCNKVDDALNDACEYLNKYQADSYQPSELKEMLITLAQKELALKIASSWLAECSYRKPSSLLETDEMNTWGENEWARYLLDRN